MNQHCSKYSTVSLFMLITAVILIWTGILNAAQSTITEVEGTACMGDDKSRKQTEQAALTDAKKRAGEFAATYIKSETQIKDFVVEKDLLSAYANAEVKILQEMGKSWYRDAAAGDCLKVRIKAEVIPDEKAMQTAIKNEAADNPLLPLNVAVWTDKKEYGRGDKIRIFIKGNKPFYASILYRDVKGGVLQLLPNPYRQDNYFNGGVVYELPSGNDRYDLEVTPPFGEENVIVYASSEPVGKLDLAAIGGVYQVRSREAGVKTRAINIKPKAGGEGSGAAEFFEGKAVVITRNAGGK